MASESISLRGEKRNLGSCAAKAVPLISDRQVDVWYVYSGAVTAPELLLEYRGLLAPEEAEQEPRFRLERVRRQFLITRALVRTALSHYTGHDPRAWRFRSNAFGKPAIAEPAGVPLEFSLSHTEGLVVCAVSAGGPVGVDAERLDRATDSLALARRYFAAEEVSFLEAVPVEQQRAAFIELWTLKEAFVKARGTGLSTPLSDFALVLRPQRPPQIRFAHAGDEDPNRWQFASLRLAEDYQIALAVGLPQGEPLSIQLRQTVPLRR